jgi:hypothetical protein
MREMRRNRAGLPEGGELETNILLQNFAALPYSLQRPITGMSFPHMK